MLPTTARHFGYIWACACEFPLEGLSKYRGSKTSPVVGNAVHEVTSVLISKTVCPVHQKLQQHTISPSDCQSPHRQWKSAPVHNGITTWIEVIFIFFLHFQNIQFLFTSGEVNETCLSTNVLHLLIFNEWNVYFQNMNSTGFRACLKELYETRYEPVSLSYAVLTGQLDSN